MCRGSLGYWRRPNSDQFDLHQACRFIIHHDVDWNPRVLEQPTGRRNRISAPAELEGKNIQTCEPYLAITGDKKMFRVVKVRAQSSNIAVGQPTRADDNLTDAEESRGPLHHQIPNEAVPHIQSFRASTGAARGLLHPAPHRRADRPV